MLRRLLILTAILWSAAAQPASSAIVFSSAPGNTLLLQITEDLVFTSNVTDTTDGTVPSNYIGILFPNVYSTNIFYAPNNGGPVITSFGGSIPKLQIDGLENAQAGIFYGQEFIDVDRNDLAIYFETYPGNVTITPGEVVTLHAGVYQIPGFFNEGTMPDVPASSAALLYNRGQIASAPVPEPSVSLLGLTGCAFALLKRQRRNGKDDSPAN